MEEPYETVMEPEEGRRNRIWSRRVVAGVLVALLTVAVVLVITHSDGGDRPSASYYLGKALKEPCPPHAVLPLFGQVPNLTLGREVEYWTCPAQMTGATKSFNFSHLTPGDTAVAAMIVVQHATSGTTFTFLWYYSSRNVLLNQQSYNIGISKARFQFAYSTLNYDDGNIYSNGSYHVVIHTSATNSTHTIYFTVTGIP